MLEWFRPSAPQNIQPVPWLHPDAIAYLGKITHPDFKVMEFGAGGSTLWFSKRVKTVVSFENNHKWVEAIQRFGAENIFVNNKSMAAKFEIADLLLIDGEPVDERAWWIEYSPYIVRGGGWIVLDNANRPEYANQREELKQSASLVHTVNGNTEKTRYLITEFWRIHESRTKPAEVK